MSLFDTKQHQMKCSKGDFTEAYLIKQINGQLIATFKHVLHPKRGTEIFVKKLPRDIVLQDIFEFAIQCGDIYQIRLLMDFSGYNRGFCFITYFDISSARKAVLTLNGEQICDEHMVSVRLSFDNNKLEVRGVPAGIGRDKIFAAMSVVIGNGLKEVITFKKKSHANKCVLKYETHRHAIEARKKVWPGIQLWGKNIEIDWAAPHEVLNSMRLYFQNAPVDVTKIDFYNDLTKYIEPKTMISMFLQNGKGSLQFVSGEAAFNSYMTLRGKTICGSIVEFSFAKFHSCTDSENKWNTRHEYNASMASINDSLYKDYMPELSEDFFYLSGEDTIYPAISSNNTVSTISESYANDREYDCHHWGGAKDYVDPQIMHMDATYENFFKVVPPPTVAVPGEYNLISEIHRSVNQYINFTHPKYHWIYLSGAAVSPNTPLY